MTRLLFIGLKMPKNGLTRLLFKGLKMPKKRRDKAVVYRVNDA